MRQVGIDNCQMNQDMTDLMNVMQSSEPSTMISCNGWMFGLGCCVEAVIVTGIEIRGHLLRKFQCHPPAHSGDAVTTWPLQSQRVEAAVGGAVAAYLVLISMGTGMSLALGNGQK